MFIFIVLKIGNVCSFSGSDLLLHGRHNGPIFFTFPVVAQSLRQSKRPHTERYLLENSADYCYIWEPLIWIVDGVIRCERINVLFELATQKFLM
jgi:hypothetical protein